MKGLKDTVQSVLESCTDIPVFYQNAKMESNYPYFVFNLRRLTENGGIEKFILEINGWDQRPTSSRIETKMDNLERNVHKLKHNDSDRVIIIYKGSKNPVDDEDKSIKRCMEQFEMHVCERRTQ